MVRGDVFYRHRAGRGPGEEGTLLFSEKSDAKKDGGALLIFSERACCRRTLPPMSESCRIFLSGQDTGLLEDLTLTLTPGEGCRYMMGKEISGKNPFYFCTERKESLLFLLAQRSDTLCPAQRIVLKEGEEIKIGRAHV